MIIIEQRCEYYVEKVRRTSGGRLASLGLECQGQTIPYFDTDFNLVHALKLSPSRMAKVKSEYIAAGGNRHPSAADWDAASGLLAYASNRNIALWSPLVLELHTRTTQTRSPPL